MPRFDAPDPDELDLAKRYDIYVAETPYRMVVYRGAFIRGLKCFAHAGTFSTHHEFIEIEQANGDWVLVRRHSVIKLCDMGGKLQEEEVLPHVPPKE
jgi:hypothetical protein